MLRTDRESARNFGPRSCWSSAPALTKTMLEHRMAATGFKACAACGQEKPISEFHKNSRMSDGLRSSCKPCVRKANKSSVLRHHEKRKAEKRAAYQLIKDTPEYQAKVKTWAAENRDAKRLYDRERHRLNRDVIIQRVKDWTAKNKDRRAAIVKAYDGRRRARTRTGISGRELADWIKKQPKVCYWCSCKCADNFHIDHYTPLSKGGLHEVSNLVVACAPCNLRKNAKDPVDFAREVGRLL